MEFLKRVARLSGNAPAEEATVQRTGTDVVTWAERLLEDAGDDQPSVRPRLKLPDGQLRAELHRFQSSLSPRGTPAVNWVAFAEAVGPRLHDATAAPSSPKLKTSQSARAPVSPSRKLHAAAFNSRSGGRRGLRTLFSLAQRSSTPLPGEHAAVHASTNPAPPPSVADFISPAGSLHAMHSRPSDAPPPAAGAAGSAAASASGASTRPVSPSQSAAQMIPRRRSRMAGDQYSPRAGDGSRVPSGSRPLGAVEEAGLLTPTSRLHAVAISPGEAAPLHQPAHLGSRQPYSRSNSGGVLPGIRTSSGGQSQLGAHPPRSPAPGALEPEPAEQGIGGGARQMVQSAFSNICRLLVRSRGGSPLRGVDGGAGSPLGSPRDTADGFATPKTPGSAYSPTWHAPSRESREGTALLAGTEMDGVRMSQGALDLPPPPAPVRAVAATPPKPPLAPQVVTSPLAAPGSIAASVSGPTSVRVSGSRPPLPPAQAPSAPQSPTPVLLSPLQPADEVVLERVSESAAVSVVHIAQAEAALLAAQSASHPAAGDVGMSPAPDLGPGAPSLSSEQQPVMGEPPGLFTLPAVQHDQPPASMPQQGEGEAAAGGVEGEDEQPAPKVKRVKRAARTADAAPVQARRRGARAAPSSGANAAMAEVIAEPVVHGSDMRSAWDMAQHVAREQAAELARAAEQVVAPPPPQPDTQLSLTLNASISGQHGPPTPVLLPSPAKPALSVPGAPPQAVPEQPPGPAVPSKPRVPVLTPFQLSVVQAEREEDMPGPVLTQWSGSGVPPSTGTGTWDVGAPSTSTTGRELLHVTATNSYLAVLARAATGAVQEEAAAQASLSTGHGAGGRLSSRMLTSTTGGTGGGGQGMSVGSSAAAREYSSGTAGHTSSSVYAHAGTDSSMAGRDTALPPVAERSPDSPAGNATQGSEPAYWAIPHDDITLIRRLGSGSYGEVWLASYHFVDVAVKLIPWRWDCARGQRTTGGPLQDNNRAHAQLPAPASGEAAEQAEGEESGATGEREGGGSPGAEERERFLRELKAFRQEVDFQRRLSLHPNIVPFIGACEPHITRSTSRPGGSGELPDLPPEPSPDTSPDPSQLAIVMGYCKMGDLFSMLRKARLVGRLITSGRKAEANVPSLAHGLLFYNTWERRLEVAAGAAAGLFHMHSRGVVHRDLTSYNILLDTGFSAKVCDFNLSVLVPTGAPNMMANSGSLNSPLWQPPEMLKGEGYDGKSLDVFSFAIILSEIITLWVPYTSGSEEEAHEVMADMRAIWPLIGKIVTGTRPWLPNNRAELTPPLPTGLSSEHADDLFRRLMALVHSCWSPEPSERPSMRQVAGELRALVTILRKARTSSGSKPREPAGAVQLVTARQNSGGLAALWGGGAHHGLF